MVQNLWTFWWKGGFCLLAELHRKGSARSLRSMLVWIWWSQKPKLKKLSWSQLSNSVIFLLSLFSIFTVTNQFVLKKCIVQLPTTISPIINRHGVVGAVLQTPLSFINYVGQSVSDPFSQNIQNTLQTVRARDLKFWDNVHQPICVTCHMSYVRCHVPHITCHISCVCKNNLFL